MNKNVLASCVRYFGLGVAALLLAGYSSLSARAGGSCKMNTYCNAGGFLGNCLGTQDGSGNCLCGGYLGGSYTDNLNCMNC